MEATSNKTPKNLIAVIRSEEATADAYAKLYSLVEGRSATVLFFESLHVDPSRIERDHAADKNVIRFAHPESIAIGSRYKLAFRLAIDEGYDQVFPIQLDKDFRPDFLARLMDAYEAAEKPEAVFGFRSTPESPDEPRMVFYKLWGSRALTAFQNWLLSLKMFESLSRYYSFSTDLLTRIPFERNSDSEHFSLELVVQCLAAQSRILQLPLPTAQGQGRRRASAIQYVLEAAKLSLHLKLMRMGFLYDRRFDLGTWEYPAKPSRWSSHTQILEAVPSGAHVLDLGCGRGGMAEELVKKNCLVDGVDILPPSEVGSSLEDYLSVDLNRNADAFFEWFRGRSYDVVILADIIEHLVDPEHFLERLRSSLGPSQYPVLIVSTGNVAFCVVRGMLTLGQFNYAPRGILDRTHTRLFTKKSFRRLFQQCGYGTLHERWVPLPLSSLSGKGRMAAFFEALNYQLARLMPGFFAYQMIFTVKPFPTTRQLLAESKGVLAAELTAPSSISSGLEPEKSDNLRQ